MTALSEYARLEAEALWHPDANAQRRDVIVSIGEASLTIFDLRETPLTHWSLPAVERLNPGRSPALYAPGLETEERLELGDETMIEAIERVRQSVARRRPRQGRLRLAILLSATAAVAALAAFWLPDAVIRHTAGVVPPVVRAEIGRQLLEEIKRVSGPGCDANGGEAALATLSDRLFGPGGARLIVLPGGLSTTEHLPGRRILLNRALVEDHESPEPAAGYILAEAERARAADPLLRFLEDAGPFAAFKLLVSGQMPPESFRSHAEALATSPPAPVEADALLARFEAAELSARPYALAVDVSGETVLPLIEADPYPQGSPRPVLSDGDWLRLQSICGE
jgi:hypothetical protein